MARLLLRDLTPGTAYKVQIRAVDGDSVSEWSRLFPLTTTSDAAAPDVPTWAVTNPWIVSGDTFVANWDYLNDTLEQNLDFSHFEIELGNGSTTKVIQTTNNTYTLTFENNRTFFGSPAPTVTARLRSVDEVGNASAWTTLKSATNPAPAAPASVTVDSGLNSLTVSWAAVADTDLIGYNVYVGTTAGFTPAAGNRIFSGDGTRTIYTTGTITTHYFKVRAVDKFGQESADATGNGTPTSPFTVDTTPPNVPAFTTANCNITNNANGIGSKAYLEWTLASAPSDLAGFYIRFRKSGDTVWTVNNFQKDDRSGQVELQLAYTNYEFQIKAFDWQNNESAWSATMTITSPANAAPGNVTGLVSTPGRDSILYSWTAVADTDIKNYEVTFATNSGFTTGVQTFLTGTATTLNVGGLAPNTTYYARVRAVDTAGNTSASWSSTDTETTGVQVPTDTYPPASSPTPNVMGGLSNLYITWSAITTNSNGGSQVDPVTYEVHLSTTTGFTPSGSTKVTEVSGTSAIVDVLPGTTTPLSYGTTYYIKLIAKDRDGSAAAGTQGSGSISKVASGDVQSIGADLIVPGTGFVNALVMATGGSIQSANYVAGSAGYKIATNGIEMNDSGSTIKADAIKAGTLGGASGSGIIQVATGTSLVLNGGYIKSNTYTGTSYNSGATAGFYLGNDGLVIAQGTVKAEAFAGGTFTAGTITVGSGGKIQGGSWYIDNTGLFIPNGGVLASKITLQSGANNMVPGQWSSFDLASSYYGTLTGTNGNGATSTWSISSTQAWHGTQSLKVIMSNGTTASSYTEYRGMSAIPVEPSKTYIVSYYLYQEAGTANDTYTTCVIDGQAYGGSYRAATGGSGGNQLIASINGWVRYTWYFTTGASETAVKIYPRILNSTTTARTNRVYYFDAIMLEQQMSNATTASSYSINGITEINGNMIRTGQIRSNTYAVVWNDTTQTWDTDTSQPAWYIDAEGDASFGNARVRGTLVIGELDGSGNVIGLESVVQSANYAPGTSGWILRSNGWAEFRQVVSDSFDGQAIRTDTLDVAKLTSSTLDKRITLATGASFAAEGSLGEEVSLGGYGFRVFGPDQIGITNKALTSNVATITTEAAHGFTAGNTVIIEGVDATFNGTYTIASTPTTTTFTYALVASNVTSTAATGIAKSKDSTNQNLGPKFIEFPTDGTQPNIISGTLTADTLIVTDGMAMYGVNNIQNGATLTIASAVLSPKSAPSVTVSYNDKQLSDTKYTPTGATVGHDGNYYVLGSGNNQYAITKHSSNNGSLLSTPVSYSTNATVYTSSYGLVYSSNYSRYYRVNVVNNRSLTTHTVIVYDTSFAQVGSYVIDNSTYEWDAATLGWDYVNNRLLLAFKDKTTGSLKIRSYTMGATGIPTGVNATLTVPSSTGVSDPAFIAFGAFDLGGNFYVYKDQSYSSSSDIRAKYYVMDSSGNAKTDMHWHTAYNTGTVYDGWWSTSDSKFYDLGATKAVRQYNGGDSYNGRTWTVTNKALTSNVATLTTSAAHDLVVGDNVVVAGVDATFNGTYKVTGVPTTTTFTYAKTAANVASTAATGTATGQTGNRYIAYTWYDGNATGGTHETGISPVYTITGFWKRSTINVTIAKIPGLGSTGQDAPNQARIYVAHDTTTPSAGTSGTYRLSNTLTYPSTVAYVSPSRTIGSTTPPTTNGFGLDTGSVGVIQSTTGNSYWKGDDTAQFYKLVVTSDTNATVNVDNKPGLRVGDPAGSHLRIGDNGIFAMNSNTDSDVRDLTLRGSQVNINVTNGYGIFTGNSNVDLKLRALNDTSTALCLRPNNIVAAVATFNNASPTASNTVGFNAADIHSWTGGLFMEDLAGGGSTTATINTNGRIIRTSTIKMKEAVQDMTDEEAYSVLGLKSYTFEYKESDGQKDPRRYPGFIAEQGAEAGAELWVGRQHKVVEDEDGNRTITRDENGEIIYFRTAEITVAHNHIIKKQQEEIKEMKEKNATLEERVEALEAALSKLLNQ